MKYSLLLLIGLLFMTIPVSSQESATGTRNNKNVPEQTNGAASFVVSNKLSYQGLLTTSAGSPVADGAYNLQFDVYNLPSGGMLRHTETLSGVDVARGTFSVMLHPPTTIFAESLYVEVTALTGPGISGPLTFSPRSELTSAPYSFAPWITNGQNIYYNNGAVGIGTSTPGFALDVTTPWTFIQAKSTSSWAGIIIDKPSASDNGYLLLNTSGTNRWTVGTMGSDDFNIHNWSTPGNPFTINLSNNYVGIGTASPGAALDVRGDVKMGTSGQYFASGGTENLRILRGIVDPAGATYNGSGFTVTHPGTGTYTINFSPAFADAPSLILTAYSNVSSPTTANCNSGTGSSFTITTWVGTVKTDNWWNFVAIGGR
jgi:hypothetical protein